MRHDAAISKKSKLKYSIALFVNDVDSRYTIANFGRQTRTALQSYTAWFNNQEGNHGLWRITRRCLTANQPADVTDIPPSTTW
jgi:hypothetical protein